MEATYTVTFLSIKTYDINTERSGFKWSFTKQVQISIKGTSIRLLKNLLIEFEASLFNMNTVCSQYEFWVFDITMKKWLVIFVSTSKNIYYQMSILRREVKDEHVKSIYQCQLFPQGIYHPQAEKFMDTILFT